MDNPYIQMIPFLKEPPSQLWEKFNTKIEEPAYQKKIILVAVCIALLLDNMLYMVIVPIIPDYLRHIGAWHTHKIGGRIEFINETLTHKLVPLRIGGKIVYEGEDAAVGMLFSIKALVQLFINPISGTVIDRIGYNIPMVIGLTTMFFSTLLFACGQSYTILFFARSLQGVGSAFADTSGLAMIAYRFTEEKERQKALGIALTFISFGCLCAPPFGGLLYEFCGKEFPFIILALVCLLDGFLVYLIMTSLNRQPKDDGLPRPKGTPIYILLKDPYILCCAGALAMANVSLAFLEPTLSIWMNDTMTVEEWQIGMVWLPAFVPYVCGVHTTVKLSNKYPRHQWLIVAIGLAMTGIACMRIPFSHSFWDLFLPIAVLCFGVAQIDTAILPTLGYLVDTRYASVYGSIYAIADISYSISYAVGPIIAGNIVESFNFMTLNVIITLSNLAYCPVLILLKRIHDYKPFQEAEEANLGSASKLNHMVVKKAIVRSNQSESNHNEINQIKRNQVLDWNEEPRNQNNPFVCDWNQNQTSNYDSYEMKQNIFKTKTNIDQSVTNLKTFKC